MNTVRGMRLRWREVAVVALSMALAWGLRGQHGHERGSALVGAMAGLALAAVTGGSRWIGAAVIGSLSFAIGGSLSYGRFVHLAYQGSLEAILSLALIGFAWGGLGSLGLGLGLALTRYRTWERGMVAGGLFVVWFLVDRLLWVQVEGPQDLYTRELMALVLLGAWAFLCAYVGVWRGDRTSLKLGLAGGIGFGIGFPLAAWIQGLGNATGVALDWWKVAEHVIGLMGGISLALAAKKMESSWTLPQAVRPWERWLAVVWLLWFLPSWLIANNLDYWITERAWFPAVTGKIVWGILFLLLIGFTLWAWQEMRAGRILVTSWLPRHLRKLFLIFVWVTTLIASSKTIVEKLWSPTPMVFILLALVITWLVKTNRTTIV